MSSLALALRSEDSPGIKDLEIGCSGVADPYVVQLIDFEGRPSRRKREVPLRYIILL